VTWVTRTDGLAVFVVLAAVTVLGFPMPAICGHYEYDEIIEMSGSISLDPPNPSHGSATASVSPSGTAQTETSTKSGWSPGVQASASAKITVTKCYMWFADDEVEQKQAPEDTATVSVSGTCNIDLWSLCYPVPLAESASSSGSASTSGDGGHAGVSDSLSTNCVYPLYLISAKTDSFNISSQVQFTGAIMVSETASASSGSGHAIGHATSSKATAEVSIKIRL